MPVGETSHPHNENVLSFRSPTKGEMNKADVFAEVEQMVSVCVCPCEVVVGTDSQVRNRKTSYVVAISVIRSGNGGAFFYRQFNEPHLLPLRQRIYKEAFLSVSLASELREYLKNRGLLPPIRLHFDIGENGPTRKYAQSLLRLARVNQFEAEVKPNSFGASTIADKFTK